MAKNIGENYDYVVVKTDYIHRLFVDNGKLEQCVKYVNSQATNNKLDINSCITKMNKNTYIDYIDEDTAKTFIESIIYGKDQNWNSDTNEVNIYSCIDNLDVVKTIDKVITESFNEYDSRGIVVFKRSTECKRFYYWILQELNYCKMFELMDMNLYQSNDITFWYINVDTESG